MPTVEPTLSILGIAIVLGSGLIAGVFLAFSSFIMQALHRIPPSHGVAAMQQINVTVINPVFLSAFMGTAALSLAAIALAAFRWHVAPARLLALAGLLYLAGTFLVTIRCNVPLNNRLAAVDPESPEAAEVWTHYLSAWTRWNHVRTIAAIAAAVLGCLGLLQFS